MRPNVSSPSSQKNPWAGFRVSAPRPRSRGYPASSPGRRPPAATEGAPRLEQTSAGEGNGEGARAGEGERDGARGGAAGRGGARSAPRGGGGGGGGGGAPRGGRGRAGAPLGAVGPGGGRGGGGGGGGSVVLPRDRLSPLRGTRDRGWVRDPEVPRGEVGVHGGEGAQPRQGPIYRLHAPLQLHLCTGEPPDVPCPPAPNLCPPPSPPPSAPCVGKEGG